MKLTSVPMVHLRESLGGQYVLDDDDRVMCEQLAREKSVRLNSHGRSPEQVFNAALIGEFGEIGIESLLAFREVKFYHNIEQLTGRYYFDGSVLLNLLQGGKAKMLAAAEIKTLDFTGSRRKWATFPARFRDNMEKMAAQADVIIVNKLLPGATIQPWLLLDPLYVKPFLRDGTPEGTVYLDLHNAVLAGAAVIIQ